MELKPRILGTEKREGYRVERIIFQTLPGVWMTATLTCPTAEAAAGGVVRARALERSEAGSHGAGAVYRAGEAGFFALAVDALGAASAASARRWGSITGDGGGDALAGGPATERAAGL